MFACKKVTKMELREYQKKIIKNCCNELTQNNKSLIVLPTGSGKTIIFTHIIKNLKVSTLIVAHTKDLVKQIEKNIKRIIPNFFHLVQVKTIQSCKNISDHFELIIIDECHRAASKIYLDLINKLENSMLLGTTATPFRLDKKSIYEIFGYPTESFTLIDMINQKFLCDFQGYRIKTNTSLSNIRIQKGDFTNTQLTAVINVKERNEIIVNEYLKIASQKKSIAFCCSVKHACDLSEEFKQKGIKSEVISGKDNKNKRDLLLKKFANGEIQVLCNCNLLTEGFDEPSIECLIMARPTISKGLYMQMIGRGSRLYPGKSICTVIEFTDNNFDVCHLDILLETKNGNFKLKQGEKLTESKKRLEKELLETTGEIILEKMEIIVPKNIYERPATIYQKKLLKDLNIKFEEPLTEFIANQLLGI